MAKRTRSLLLALAAVPGLAALASCSNPFDSADTIGMTETPCTAQGTPVTERKRDDWADLCRYRADNARLLRQGARPKAVLIGDSLTQAWPEMDPAPFDGTLVGRGIGGQTSPQVLLRFQQDAVALHPRVVHILVGTNDIAGNTGPTAPGMAQANIRAMVDIARANGIQVVLATIPPAREFNWRPEVKPGDWVHVMNRWIRQFAAERGLVLADYYSVLAMPDGAIDPGLFADGAHPSAAGYRAMRPVLLEALAEAEKAADARQKAPAAR